MVKVGEFVEMQGLDETTPLIIRLRQKRIHRLRPVLPEDVARIRLQPPRDLQTTATLKKDSEYLVLDALWPIKAIDGAVETIPAATDPIRPHHRQ